jgi:hypothetical protein
LFPCKFRACLLQFFKQQNDFSRINIGLLEIVDHLLIVEELIERDPARIDIKLLKLILEVTALVHFSEENIFCLLDAPGRQKELNLVLWGDFHELVDL